jgi:VIT1/CCC1 family predicted Fe2+/Mn2+ transporter
MIRCPCCFDDQEALMKTAGRLGMTVLGIYLIVSGILPYLPFLAGLSPLMHLAAIVAGVLILLGR